MSWVVAIVKGSPFVPTIVGTFRTWADAADWAHDNCWTNAVTGKLASTYVVQLTTPAKAVWR